MLEQLHPKALHKVRPTAQYVTAGHSEIVLKRYDDGLWRMHFYRIPRVLGLPKIFQTAYRSKADAERVLIPYLKRNDKWRKAIWPGRTDSRYLDASRNNK